MSFSTSYQAFMLSLLLDEHIPQTVDDAVGRICVEASIVSLRDWNDGVLLGRGDHEIVAAAHKLGYTFVTYDLRTMPSLLKHYAESGISHGGVIYVDQRTILPSDIGGLVRALATVIERYCNRDWTNQTQFLEK